LTNEDKINYQEFHLKIAGRKYCAGRKFFPEDGNNRRIVEIYALLLAKDNGRDSHCLMRVVL
jgi:hypothetical protein